MGDTETERIEASEGAAMTAVAVMATVRPMQEPRCEKG